MKKVLNLLLACFVLAALMAGCVTEAPVSSETDRRERQERDTQNNSDDIPPDSPQSNDDTPQSTDNTTPLRPSGGCFNVSFDAIPLGSDIKTIDISPEQELWINGTHAVLTVSNGLDVSIYGGAEPSPEMRIEFQCSLNCWWSITGHGELIDTISRLTSGMHNTRFLDDAEYYGITEITEEELIYELQHADDDTFFYFQAMFEAYSRFGENAIMAWDLSRAVQLYSQGYMAGYISYDEALTGSLYAGKIIQETFGSWNDFWESYLYGYFYWSGDVAEFIRRIDIIGALFEREDSPFNLEWFLDLG
jgi:hypothetical protein